MPTPTYTPLWSTTLAASTSSVSISGIPQGYRDLVLVIGGTLTASEGNTIRFNGDSGSNYSEVSAYVRAQGTITSGSGTGTTLFGDYFDGGVPFVKTIQIMDYSATDKHKAALCRVNAASTSGTSTTPLGMLAGRWANTAAVTSITCLSSTTTYAAGSTFALFGIAG